MEKKAKVIFVNSFKGGAGKTTLALAHCISNLFHKDGQQYENIIYMDLDVLGTGTCYLFQKGTLPEEKSFEKTEREQKVSLKLHGKRGDIHVAYLNPALKTRSVYGDMHYTNHQGIVMADLKDKVLRYLKARIKEEPSTLIVMDCAPGFTGVEQAILQECYKMSMDGKVQVEELYVTTLDSSHVQKCIQCLKDSVVGMVTEWKYRNVQIVLNDVQNYSGYIEDEEADKVEQKWNDIVNDMLQALEFEASIKNGISRNEISIIRWKYSQEMAMQTTYGNESVVENHPDCYVFTDENYKMIHSKEA